MNTAVLIITALILGFAAGRLRSLNGFGKTPCRERLPS